MILYGEKIAKKIKKSLKQKIADSGIHAGLATILVGKNPASVLYIKRKEKFAKDIGIYFKKHEFKEENTSEKTITDCIKNLNANPRIHGILVQFPLPKHLNADKIVQHIDPKKDADGFHPENIKNFLSSKRYTGPVPVTPCALLRLLKETRTSLSKKTIVIVGKCSIFLDPLFFYFTLHDQKPVHVLPNARDLKEQTQKADILITAAGIAHLITRDMVKDGVIVIDVGINQKGDKTVGDVDFDQVAPIARWITPVPGGVGPVTVATLMQNVVNAWQHGAVAECPARG